MSECPACAARAARRRRTSRFYLAWLVVLLIGEALR